MSRPARTLRVPRTLANSPTWGRLARSLSDRASEAGIRGSETLIVLADRGHESFAVAQALFGVQIDPGVDADSSRSAGLGCSDRRGSDGGIGASIAGWIEDREHALLRLPRREAGWVRRVSGVAVILIRRGVVQVASLADLLRAAGILSPQIAANRGLIERAAARVERASRGKKQRGGA